MAKKGAKRSRKASEHAGIFRMVDLAVRRQEPVCAGMFITGTDTGVGKTYVAALIARQLVEREGLRVGVYKPVASGCRREGKHIISDDAVALWEAAGKPGRLEDVCPQRFLAPLAPHLAAAAENKEVDVDRLIDGLKVWTDTYDFVLVEGVGGWLSPIGFYADEDFYVADLACEFKYPAVVVTANRLGTINQTLQTLMTILLDEEDVDIAGIVVNDVLPQGNDDPSTASNLAELTRRCAWPILSHIQHGDQNLRNRILEIPIKR
jgi:dethiobiotin synthetase